MTVMTPDREARADEEKGRRQVAAAARILSTHGHEDLTLGHVSVRSSDGQSMWIKRKGVSLRETSQRDVVKAGLGPEPPNGLENMHLEAVMHHEAYRRRPEVNAVIHTHPPFATALGAAGAELQMISHDSVLFHEGIGRYDKTFGLITTSELAAGVLDALADKKVVLLVGHGILAVGPDIAWAVLAAINLEKAVLAQLNANLLGQPTGIPEPVAAELFLEKYQDRFLNEYWDSWCRQLHDGFGDQ